MSEFNELMQELQRQYRSSLLDRIAELFDLYNQIALTDWQFSQVRAFHHQVHSLTGSAGTFGMKPLSTAARALEVELKQLMHSPEPPTYRQWQNIQQALVGIEQLAASFLTMEAPTYLPDLTPTTSNSEAPLVYLIEDDLEQAEHIAIALEQAGCHLQHFKDLTSFRSDRSAADCPDVVILDLMLPEGENAGLEVLTDLKNNAACQPAVICVSVRDDFETRLAAYRAGANRYMLKPVMTEELLGLVNTLSRRGPDEPYRVVIVDDDPLLLQVQAMQLEAAGMEVKSLDDVRSIFTTLDQFKPDVLILDVYMPTATGPELASIIREREAYLSLPIIFLSAESDLQQQLLALNLGGDDFLVKPVQSEHLISAVTARAKRARQVATLEARLRNSLYEREREHLAVNQHAIVSVADKHGNIIDVNEKFCEISGYDRSELIGQNHRIVKSGEHPAEFYQQLWRTISQGHIWQGVICNRAKDGSLYWVESSITPFLDEAGKPYQYVSIRTDITRQIRSEQAVELAKERLRRGQIYANIGTCEWNIGSGELFWTEQIAPLFGYAKGELETSYENFLNAIHPDDRDKVIAAVNDCVEKGSRYHIEHRVVWPDGTIRWLLEKGDVLRDSDGKPLKMIGVVQDVHDRKMAEISLAEREQQLVEAQSLANLGNWHANLQTGELFWSDQVYKIFGYEPGEFSPSVQAFHNAVHPDDVELVRKSEQLAKQTGRHDVIHRILRPDASVRYVHELAQMQLDLEGNPCYMHGTVQDVTEIQLAKEAAERANRAKSEFLSSMSHELRTPLNSIIGFSQLLALSDLSDKQKKQLGTITQSGKHLLSLINDVLEFAKLENGKIHLNIQPIDVKPIIEQVVALSESHAYANNIHIKLASWQDQHYIQADPVRFQQILVNLMSNGIKYNRPNGLLTLNWQTETRAQQPFWRLTIQDTGYGIAEEDIPRLFVPFDRLGHESSTIEGTGIGLSITKDLVEQMGGYIEVDSNPNVGTAFSIGLPLAHQSHIPYPTLSNDLTEPSPTQHGAHQPIKVLYVEDNPANMKLMAEIAQLVSSMELRIAPTAENGLKQAEQWLPELILLDIHLPGMNGDEAIAHFRALPAYHQRQATICAVTANILPEQVEHYQHVGFDEVIGKPFEVSQIIQLIERVADHPANNRF